MDYNARLREASREILEGRIIDDAELRKVADKYNIPLSTVKTLSTFYFHDYSENQVCMGLPCVLKGSREVAKELDKRGIKYTITYCLGYCDKGPVVKLNGKLHTYVDGDFREITEASPDYVLSNRESLGDYLRRGGFLTLIGSLTRMISSSYSSYSLRSASLVLVR